MGAGWVGVCSRCAAGAGELDCLGGAYVLGMRFRRVVGFWRGWCSIFVFVFRPSNVVVVVVVIVRFAGAAGATLLASFVLAFCLCFPYCCRYFVVAASVADAAASTARVVDHALFRLYFWWTSPYFCGLRYCFCSE